MAQLLLYKNFSKRKNSTKQPTSADYTLDIKTKVPVSLQNPVFRLATVDLDVNYCYFEGHYYYVDDIQLNLDGLYELHCSMDELASHKTEIGATTQMLSRSPLSATTLTDSLYVPTTSSVITNVKETSVSSIDTDGCYLVRFTSCETQNPYIMTPEQFYKYFGALGTLSSLADVYKYVVSVLWAPFSAETLKASTTKRDVVVGLLNLTSIIENSGVTVGQCYTAGRVIGMPDNSIDKPTLAYNDNRDYDTRITSCMLRIFGANIPLPAEYLRPLSILKWDAHIDLWTGQCVVDLKCNGAVINTFTKNVCIPVQYTAASANIGAIAQTVAGGTITAISTAATATSGVGAAVGVASAVVGTASGVASNILNQNTAVTGSAGSFADSVYYNKVYCTVVQHSSNDIDNDIVGYPAGIVRRIDTLVGYIQCINAHVDIAAFGGDKDIIESYMNTGFYYE